MTKAIYKYENKINHKIYIGQTNDPHKRHLEHISGTKSKNISLIDKAIQKYGIENFDYEILEWTENYNERERYWIEYYRSLIPYGYNICEGGGYLPNQQKEQHSQAKISEQTARAIQEDLMNYSIPRKQIVKKYKVTDSIVRNICSGHTWNYYDLEYPLRPTEPELNKIKAKEVIKLLKETQLSFKEIGSKVGWGESQIRMINCGENHHQEDATYPIRSGDARRKLTDETLAICIDMLKEGKSNTEIGKALGVSASAVRLVNVGKSYFNKSLTYPIRK